MGPLSRRTSRPRARWKPASLRGRVRVAVVGLLALLLVLLFVAVDVALEARLEADLRTRLTDRVALAEQLSGSLDPDQLVQQLRGDNVLAEVCDGDSGYCASTRVAPAPPGVQTPPADRPGRGPAAQDGPGEQQVRSDGDTLFLVANLEGGQRLTLQVDASTVSDTLSRLVILEVVGGAAALVVAWFALGRVVGVALRPLDTMTSVARDIAAGDRGRRLGSGRPDTELGRTALAFDAMLDELESAVARAERSQEQMRAFLSDASHELRTPLAGFQASAENLLRGDPDREDRERALAAMVRESRRASRLVGDLLTAARLEEGVELERAEVDLVELARQEVERQRLLAPSTAWSVEAAGSVVTVCDAGRVGQVLTNVLDNARRAVAGAGSVVVSVRSDGLTAVLEVRDSGPGIPADQRERVFERLVRLDAGRDRGSGGAGLGLAIARGIARAHGGDLVAADPGAGPDGVGAGAVLRLTLPLTPA
ncbi:Signal transduction histidine kinase [Quadrisphaera granulorum]|uniref:histidine kinase n=1 Tax=Quadrisphaera granulorum TaxID=317664 RepID=A0A316A546_9ACTN|nr:HAMP domain-containing sensor histidine kinase [Quadrisphaera granulorum]PWJ52683.1 signal transduction histidine kinase [Quadrisphaera granulorum]SZE97505.1 Signal transduction histidine kinase [Quadrisphaera granulorum]